MIEIGKHKDIIFKKQTRNIPPFKMSNRLWHHMCRYGYITGNHNQPGWITRVETCYFNLTREGLANG